MNAQVIQLAPIRIAMLRHTGSYDEIGPVFDRLWKWVEAQNVPVQRTIGIYWDDPDEVPAPQLRSAACVEIPEGYQVGGWGAPEVGQIAGGTYVTARFVGPYDDLAPVWNDLWSYCENDLRRTISEEPAFEVYVNDPGDTPPERLITDLYMPVI